MLHRFLSIDLITRCAILTQVSMTCALAWLVPTSLTARLISEGSSYAHWLLILLTTVAGLGWLDVLINDVLPDSCQLCWTRTRRHTIYHLLAGIFFIQAFAGVGERLDAEDLLSLVYMLNGLIAAWYSWAISIRATHV